MLVTTTGLKVEAELRDVVTVLAIDGWPTIEFSAISTPVATILGLPVIASTVTEYCPAALVTKL
jgi:hypothetical protein